MKANDYQSLAWSTAKPFYKHVGNGDTFEQLKVCTMTLALAGEAGELANKLKKMLENGDSIDRKVLEDELGDVLWYCASLAKLLSLPLEDVMGHNIAKLRARYGDVLPSPQVNYGK